MRTEAQKIARKAYREANKEKLAAQQKIRSQRYYKLNKEKVATESKKWVDNNPEASKAHKKKWKDKNPEYDKNYISKYKNGKYTMYYLPYHHYIGVTNCIYLRMKCHKSEFDRYIDDVEIVAEFDTKAEALHYERLMHSIGYN
jgi:hypothetical protein